MTIIQLVIAFGLVAFLGYIQGQADETRRSDGNNCPTLDTNCTCCISGYIGIDCRETCNNCMSRVIDGKCIAFCKPGYYGYHCNKSCPRTCATGNKKAHDCEKEKGSCTIGCIDGKYGEYCNLTCHSNCPDGICYPNGDCRNCNSSNFFGKFCNTPCSEGCKNKTCNRNGKCMGGCRNGFYGDTCEQCGNNCKKERCISDHIALYNCTDGCKPGYTGINCSKDCPPHCEHCDQEGQRCMSCVDNYVLQAKTGGCVEEDQTGAVVGVVAGGVIVVIIIAIIAVILKRRKMQNTGSSGENCDTDHGQNTPMLLERVNDVDNGRNSLDSNQGSSGENCDTDHGQNTPMLLERVDDVDNGRNSLDSNQGSSGENCDTDHGQNTPMLLERVDDVDNGRNSLDSNQGSSGENCDTDHGQNTPMLLERVDDVDNGRNSLDSNQGPTSENCSADQGENTLMLPERTEERCSVDTKEEDCELCQKVKQEKKNVRPNVTTFVRHKREVKGDCVVKLAVALMNTDGGQICLHWTNEENFKDLENRINRLQPLTDNTDFCTINPMQNRQNYMEINLNKTPDVATVKFNTKVLANVNENKNPSTQYIKDFLSNTYAGSRNAGHEQQQVKKYLDYSSPMPSIDNVVEDIWKNSKLKHYISSMSKVKSGGIFEVFVKNFDVENEALKMRLQEFIEENICILASEIFEETKRFFDINIESDNKDEIHIKVTIKKVDGIVFYDPHGPISHTVVDKKTARMDKEEWSRRITEGSGIKLVWSQ